MITLPFIIAYQGSADSRVRLPGHFNVMLFGHLFRQFLPYLEAASQQQGRIACGDEAVLSFALDSKSATRVADGFASDSKVCLMQSAEACLLLTARCTPNSFMTPARNRVGSREAVSSASVQDDMVVVNCAVLLAPDTLYSGRRHCR